MTSWNRGDGFGGTPLSPVTDDDPIDEISEIEARIEALARIAERCRKFILASKVAIAGGGVLLLIVILGLFGAGQSSALGSIALMLGGIVSLGSNIGTLRQADAAISAAEMLRSELIDRIDPSVVRDTPMKLV
jgi:hypothetical protein